MSILLLVLLTVPALCQQSGAELRLMRENTRLMQQVDSLTAIVRNLSEVDAIWAQLSGVEEGESEWGSHGEKSHGSCFLSHRKFRRISYETKSLRQDAQLAERKITS